MAHYLTDAELERTAPAEVASFKGPVPTQIVSNGEFNPPPQTQEQRRVESRVDALAGDLAPRHGLSRRQFLASSAGMAAAFLAMNDVFGPIFDVQRAEAATPGLADARAQALAGQLIVDAQTHFVRDDFKQEGLLDLAKYAKQHWNRGLWGESTLARYKFENYVKEIFVDSDTKVALLSGAPFDDPTWNLLTNDQIATARAAINQIAGSRRLLGHAVFTPKKAGWLDEFEQTGRIKWATDLAEIPSKLGVKNVYAEVGTAFANSAVADPRFAAAFVGTLVRGLGAEHVLWGTDSLWYGSPQWQIEALRRLEIPEEMQRKHGFAPLGPADGIVKSAIFGGNAARLYGLHVKAVLGEIGNDQVAAIKAQYVAMGGMRSNTRYGYVARV